MKLLSKAFSLKPKKAKKIISKKCSEYFFAKQQDILLNYLWIFKNVLYL